MTILLPLPELFKYKHWLKNLFVPVCSLGAGSGGYGASVASKILILVNQGTIVRVTIAFFFRHLFKFLLD